MKKSLEAARPAWARWVAVAVTLAVIAGCGDDGAEQRGDAAPTPDAFTLDAAIDDAAQGDAAPPIDGAPADGAPTGDGAPAPDAAAPPTLSVVPLSLAFGPVVLGSSSGPSTLTVHNLGGLPTGTLAVSLGGADPGHFALVSDACSGRTLAAGATCTVEARFAPTAAGARTAVLTAAASPGGSAASSLSGSGLAPGALGIAPLSSSFPDTVQGQTSAARTFTLTNSGTTSTGTIALTRSGTTPSAFTIVPSADQCSGRTLAGAASCRFDVTFTPATPGAASASVTATASPGGAAAAMLTGTALSVARLTGSVTSHDFGATAVGSSASFVWTVSNSGDLASGAVTVSPAGGSAAEYTHTTTCSGALAPGATCTVTITFRPVSAGARSGVFSASAAPGGSAMLNLTAAGSVRLIVVPSGTGTVASTDGRIQGCTSSGGTCSADYTSAAAVTLQARTSNGSQSHFQAWSGAAACTGPLRDCVQAMDQHRTIVATFASHATAGNLMFLTARMTYANAMGGDEAMYDRICNDTASAAGLNDRDAPGGSSYLAWISTATPVTGNARARLGPAARGFIRLDGQLVADDQTTMFSATSPRIFHAPLFDETGQVALEGYVWTGTLFSGATGNTCNNWSSGGSATGGRSNGGAPAWTTWGAAANACASPVNGHLLCIMKTNTAAITPPAAPPGAKRMVVSTNSLLVGMGTPDARCQADAGPSYRAFISTSTAPASALLSPATTYVRPDGTVLGTGAELAANRWHSGVWQTSDGSYLTVGTTMAWTGSDSPGLAGTTDSTCTDWSDSATPGYNEKVGSPGWEGGQSWFAATTDCRGSNFRVLCVEQ